MFAFFMITILTISAQLILISGLVPNSPMEWSVLFYGIVLHALEFIVWYGLVDAACSRWGSSRRVRRLSSCGRVPCPRCSDLLLLTLFLIGAYHPIIPNLSQL